MKTTPFTPAALAITAVILLGSPRAAGQSADGFDTSGLVPAPAPAAPAPAAAPAAAAELLPSRFAGEDQPAYVRQLVNTFSIRKRTTDPFGRYQDPDFVAPRPVKQLATSPTQRFQAEPPTPFIDIVAAITVNLVMPDKGQFLIGDRAVKVGEVLPLQLPSGKQLKVQVLAVTSTRIDFRNLATGEAASRQLDMLPEGMRKGTGTITAPGVQPAGKDAPVQIQPATPLSNNG